MSKGFTLIELLVVVLIIGILSAVALPQYEKTVHKARMSEVMTRIPAFERAITLQYLTEGSFNSDMKDFDPDVFAGLVEQDPFFLSPMAYYMVDSINAGTSCWRANYTGKRASDANVAQSLIAELGGCYSGSTGEWTRYCFYESDLGKALCKPYEAQGWDVSEGF